MQDKLVAIIVTVVQGESYDSLFRTVPQLAAEGERVAVYQAPPSSLEQICKILDGETPAEDAEAGAIAQLAKDLTQVEGDSVVFNWECCSGCGDEGFHGGGLVTLELIEKVISRGSMVMASDFSLKALIKDWQVDLLGPNPFIKIGEFDSKFTLKFDPEMLNQCPSAQLQKVGELCAEGSAESHALGGTIAYTVDAAKCETQAYTLQVLTVASAMPGVDVEGLPKAHRCTIGEHSGAAGHVLLTYPTGGQLLTSCGHWIELSKLDVSLDNLFKVAEQTWGGEYATQMRSEYATMESNGMEADAWISQKSCQMVQQSAPCNYSKKK